MVIIWRTVPGTTAIARFWVPPRGTFSWQALPGQECVFPTGIAALEIQSPPFTLWEALWSNEEGHVFVTTSSMDSSPMEQATA